MNILSEESKMYHDPMLGRHIIRSAFLSKSTSAIRGISPVVPKQKLRLHPRLLDCILLMIGEYTNDRCLASK